MKSSILNGLAALAFATWLAAPQGLSAAQPGAAAGWFSAAASPNSVGSLARTPTGATHSRQYPTRLSSATSPVPSLVAQTSPPSDATDPANAPVAPEASDNGVAPNEWAPPAPNACASSGDVCCDLESGCRPGGMFYVGAEYLLVRPRFSQAVFMVQRETSVDAQNLVNRFTDKTVEYAFDYDSSFRAQIGYHLCGCGGDIQFTYWRLTANSQMSSGIVNFFANPGTIIAGQLEINPADPIGPATPNGANPTADNEALSGSLHLAQDIYDLDFSKCLPLGGADGGCDPCGCPAWELRWLAGARATNMARLEENAAAIPGQAPSKTGEIFTRFAGGGPRVGILGRRYAGKDGWFSLYGKANQSLLMGTTSITRRRITAPTSPINPVIFDEHMSSLIRAVPCTEIEVGGGLQVSPHAFLSAGWFVQAWWDLGMPEQPDGTNFGPLTSANVLAWDGLFVRGEFVY